MDAHTARCLQLSTSINPPFHGPYRHNRFDSMNMSRYHPQQQSSQQQQPQQQQQQVRRPAMQRASSMPAVYRNAAAMQPAAFKQSFNGSTMLGMSPADISPSNSSNFDTTSLFSAGSATVSPNTGFDADTTWDPTFGIDMKQMQGSHDGLGMSFLENDLDLSNPFGVSSDGLDLIHLNEQDHHIDFSSHAMSPAHRSDSSESSADNLGQLPEMGIDANVLSQDIPMPTVEEESTGFGRARHSRSNSRAPAPRASSTRRYRRAPYSFDAGRGPFEGHRRSSSVMSAASSIGSCQPVSMPATQCCSPVNEYHDDFGLTDFSQLDFSSAQPSVMGADDIFTVHPMTHMANAHMGAELIAPQPKYPADQLLFGETFEDPFFENKAPIVPSSQIANERPLHSNVDEFADYAEEPDLFGALSEEQSVPSEEDMNPEDESMKPQEQETRFDGDLYTPRFVRGTGVNREGYCGLCKPGRWLVLKNSAFWYDKSFTHGISAATGQPFDGPKETRRMSGNPDVWEGLCGGCNEWIALISNKKKGTTWFRHAYKCHSQNKNKDGSKKKGSQAKASLPKEKHTGQCCGGDAKSSEAHAPATQVHPMQTIGSFF